MDYGGRRPAWILQLSELMTRSRPAGQSDGRGINWAFPHCQTRREEGRLQSPTFYHPLAQATSRIKKLKLLCSMPE
jgi:hypothetical protein